MQMLRIHPVNPQLRLVRQAAEALRAGALMVYPTDSGYALGCRLGDKEGIERIRRIRELPDHHHLTLICRDLSELGQYARVDNSQYRLLKSLTPGAYTFILRATREVPRRLQHPKRKTIGLRVPDHPVALSLLAELDEPILSSTLILPSSAQPLTDPHEIGERLGSQIDLLIDAGLTQAEPTTVVDLLEGPPVVVRPGAGDLRMVGA
ncbi:threonylcarbamoyl-AMP synthase [Ectothiorhodospiraceae bacterium 2226]|nr:threonylcarbamoyl-AMP synthase [Ectothiorhodospiraceae bacterium 2226]